MVKNKTPFCNSHHMIITLRTVDDSGNEIGLCNLCRRERAGPTKTVKRSRSGPQVVVQEHLRGMYEKLDDFLRNNHSLSNYKIAEELGVDNRTVARRRKALGMGSSKAGRLPEEIAIHILEIHRATPLAPVSEIAKKAGCSRGSVSSVLANPKRYVGAYDE